MDLQSLQDMKYSELLKLTNKLGIEFTQTKKKDNLIQAILNFYGQKSSNQDETNENKENEPEQAPKKKVKKVKKLVKKSKKSQEVEDEPEVEIDPMNQTMTRSRTHTYMNQTLNKTGHLETEKEPIQQVEDKKVKKTTKKDDEECEVIVSYEIREDGKKVKKTKRIKKKVKSEKNVDEELEKDEIDEKKVKKVKKVKKKSKDPKVVENVEPVVEEIPQVAQVEEVDNLSEDQMEQNFRLELEDDDVHDEQKKDSHEEPKVENKADTHVIEQKEVGRELEQSHIESEVEQHEAVVLNLSLITNDEEKSNVDEREQHDNLEITLDVDNSTSGKKEDEESRVVVSDPFVNSHKFDESEEKKTEFKENKQEEEQPKPKTGGARIVRPKQTVTVLQSIKTTRNETVVEEVKKVVEIVNREAGPRIVKPVIAVEDSVDPKRKNANDANANTIKKVKENQIKKKAETETAKVIVPRIKAAPAPDFKALHEKESQKMESIDSFANRKHDRFNKLTTDKSPNPLTSQLKPDLQLKPKTPTILTKSQSIFAKKTPLKTGTTPKFAKNLASTASNLLSNIPRLLRREDKEVKKDEVTDTQPVEPKTPEPCDQEKKSKLLKTPSSIARPTESSLLKSNVKRNTSLKLNLNDPTSLASIPPQLQTSSFVRRKSYDLSKSLTKPLGYNPHHGKLKKIDFNTKSVFLKSLQTTTNLNESKCVDVLKTNDSILNESKKTVSTISKLRCDNGGGCADRNMITDFIKSDKLKQSNDKSTQLAKKLRIEKAKLHKQARSDQNRQLSDLENFENEQLV